MPCFLQTLCTFALANGTRGVAQLVSAPRSGRGGRKFESSHPDKKKRQSQVVAFFISYYFVIVSDSIYHPRLYTQLYLRTRLPQVQVWLPLPTAPAVWRQRQRGVKVQP